MRYLPVVLAALLCPALAPATTVDTGQPAPEEAEETTAPPLPPGTQIYLVARAKTIGTDFTQVAFFRHNDIITLEGCEAERAAGMTAGSWKRYPAHQLKAMRGTTLQIDYRCVTSTQYFRHWRRTAPQTHYYLVRTPAAGLQVETFDNFFACRRELRRSSAEESIDTFCSISSQDILPAPPPEAEATELSPDAATVRP